MSRESYHHGDLRAALLMSAEQIIRDDGVEGFSLRKAAKQAGVSPGAPAYHFGDAKGLLTAVATRAFESLGVRLHVIPPTGNAAQDLRNQAVGYVAYAAENPGLFGLICRVDLIDCRNPDFLDASFAAMARYSGAAAAYFRQEPPDPRRRVLNPHLTGALATAHGLAHIVLEGRAALVFTTPDPTKTFIETTLPAILSSVWPDRGRPDVT